MLSRFVVRGITMLMLMLLLVSTPLRAAPDLDLNTRFIQGSFDILLPDGWVATLDESGTTLSAEGPEFATITIELGTQGNQTLFDRHDLQISELEDDNTTVTVLADAKRDPMIHRRVVLETRLRLGELYGQRFQVQISRPSNSQREGIFATLKYVESAGLSHPTRLLEAVLDSVNVVNPPAGGQPVYQLNRSAPLGGVASVSEIVGDWKGVGVLGDFEVRRGRLISTSMWSFNSPLSLSADGSYVHEWFGQRTVGLWQLVQDQLHLTTSDDEVLRYQVTLRKGRLLLRGPCHQRSMHPVCIDLYSGEERRLGFVFEPVAAH